MSIYIRPISTGLNHSLVITNKGKLYSCGNNTYGQLGDLTKTNRTTFVPVFGDDWRCVATLVHSSLGIKKDGSLWSWGRNDFGQLGLGAPLSFHLTYPYRVGSGSWDMIAGGGYHAIGLKPNGSVWGWGLNANGQIGDNTFVNKDVPIGVSGLSSGVKFVACGNKCSFAIKTDGTLWAWGEGVHGQLAQTDGFGFGDDSDQPVPVQIGSATNWVMVSGGYEHMLAINSDGEIYGSGEDEYGQLGLNDAGGSRYLILQPAMVAFNDWKYISCSGYHSLGLRDNEEIYCSGRNNVYQICDGTTTDRITSTREGRGDENWSHISTGHSLSYTNFALKKDGSLWAGGYNSTGLLGLGDTSNRDYFTPIPVDGIGTYDWMTEEPGSEFSSYPVAAPATYDDAVARYHTSYAYVLEINIEGTIRRYSYADMTLNGIGHVEGRIISGGSVDRVIDSLEKRSDLTVTLADTDGAISALYNFNTAASNILRAIVTVKRGSLDLPYGDWQNVASFEYAELIELDDSGLASISFRSADPKPSGRVNPPSELDVWESLIADYPTQFPAAPVPVRTQKYLTTEDLREHRVPFLFGRATPKARFSFIHKNNVWPGYAEAEANPILYPEWRDGLIAIIGLNPHGFMVSGQYIFSGEPKVGGGIKRYIEWGGWRDRGIVSGDGFAQFWLNDFNAYALCLKVVKGSTDTTLRRSFLLLEADNIAIADVFENPPEFFWIREIVTLNSSNALDPIAKPIVPPTYPSDPGPYTISDAAEAVFTIAEDGDWSTDADTAAWAAATEEYSGIYITRSINESISALDAISEIAKDIGAWVYINRDDEISIAFIPNDGVPTPDLVVDSEHMLLKGSRARMPEDGIGALINVTDIKNYVLTNNASITRHQKEGIYKSFGNWLKDFADVHAIHSRLVGTFSDPRWTVDFNLSLIGTSLEIGDVVELDPSFVSAWVAPRLCIVTRLVEDLDTGRVRATAVDFDDVIRSKIYRTNTGLSYVTTVNDSIKYNLTVTAGNATVRCTVQDSANADALQDCVGDILCSRSASQITNRFNALITNYLVIQTPVYPVLDWIIDLTITDSHGGSLPGVNQTDYVEWEIVRGYVNRLTSVGYYTAQTDIYGFVANTSDGSVATGVDGYVYGGT